MQHSYCFCCCCEIKDSKKRHKVFFYKIDFSPWLKLSVFGRMWNVGGVKYSATDFLHKKQSFIVPIISCGAPFLFSSQSPYSFGKLSVNVTQGRHQQEENVQ